MKLRDVPEQHLFALEGWIFSREPGPVQEDGTVVAYTLGGTLCPLDADTEVVYLDPEAEEKDIEKALRMAGAW